MRLTTRTNLAMRTLMFCAVNSDRIVRKHEIAEACNASENHLAQVVNTLAQRGFVETQRGRSGGLRLAREMDSIGVGEVLRTFEASLPFVECFDADTNSCPLANACRFRDALEAGVEAFYSAMDRHTLGDMVRDNGALEHLLHMSGQPRVSLCGSPARKRSDESSAQPATTPAE
ncbi:BadM/Rrf2 family transcriptional regulator [Rhodobacter aestuarii]|uniref:Transcriptional regulator, BadM/Rrf2 family n=1 Tax=Rhodobacter aestuarii TaxID=453582 RepID=A0A1N7M4X1_9RHOB|nr:MULTISPECIES: Rrf2 family transcriptional regulator [Rhodobacter]PTV94847.1 BadM/Rrf2 family transcriptional regulator [Rhodobacter aestuarii]SIS81117.1 transcriptional regulator, BadM/Rrf2 family [Rhodobacter aestuarii]SOC14157.1 BadM/Rrf2 family transcriptional regulator [Rhodobacter sp. JA431]